MQVIPSGGGVFLLVAWRNLWRNRRRTILTICGIAFGVFLVQIMMAVQSGSYQPMVDVGTRMGQGHLQLVSESYQDERRVEYSIDQVQSRLTQLDESPYIESSTARAEGMALVSRDPSSTAALIVGVIPDREQLVSDIPSKVTEGAYLKESHHAVIGAALGRVLDVGLGDELVVIGSNPTGGIAALIVEVGGIYRATTQIERALIHVELATFQDAFEMEDQAHRIVAMVKDPFSLADGQETLQNLRHEDEEVLDWEELMPEISENIQLDVVSNAILQFVLILIIVLSIVNTFVMIMFERTREYGMLFAIGMQRFSVLRMAVTEACMLWLVGTAAGVVLMLCLVLPLMHTGIPIPVDTEALQDRMSFMPDAIYPDLSWWATLIAPLSIGVGTLLAVLLTSIRLLRLNIVDSLRTE